MDHQIKKKMSIIHSITNLDIYYMDSEFKRLDSFIHMEYPLPIDRDIKELFDNISCSAEVEELSIYEYSSSMELRFLVTKIRTDVVIVGPIIFDDLNFREYLSVLNESSSEESDIILSYIEHMDFYSTSSYETLSLFIYNILLCDIKIPVINKIQPHNTDRVTGVSDTEDITQDFENFSHFLQNNFDRENRVLSYIEKGEPHNIESDKELYQRSNQYLLHKRSSITSIRNQKNLAITANSLGLRAAIKGGLPMILGYNLSNRNVRLIEKYNNPVMLSDLLYKMYMEYSTLVRDNSNRSYSNLIKEVMDYILSHLTTQINLKTITEHIFVNPSYLSRRFKQETGLTVIQFINSEKIKLVIQMMQEKRYSLTEIADKMGFNSYSHFAHTFKKITHKSPSDYLSGID